MTKKKQPTTQVQMLPMSVVEVNAGQLQGLPANPREIRDEKFEKLKANIQKYPELLEYRSLMVYPMPNGKHIIIGGNMRYRAMQELGYTEVPCVIIPAETPVEKLGAYTILDNNDFGKWDWDLLANEWSDWNMEDLGLDWDFSGFGEMESNAEKESKQVEEDDFDEEKEEIPTRVSMGEVWLLGEHRLMCGDSTDAGSVVGLMDGKKADLVFTDPPYGMKKEKVGVLNDNLNFDDLLEFNKRWIPLTFANLKDNGSWYCWGIDEPLMDIYSNILKPMIKSREICFRNLITWDKGSGQGQRSEALRMYPIADEKCLFVMVGWEAVQGFTVNSCDYSPVMEPLRSYLEGEIKRLGENDDTIANALGWTCGRTVNHWYSKSQFALPTKENYEALRAYGIEKTGDADFLKHEYDSLKHEYYAGRSFFDNTHDSMNNVWHFKRTGADERQDVGGHATPKPLALCARGIKTSSREGEIVLDVFGGSGSTLIACEQLNRKCYMMELDPHYCDVIIARWEKLAGKQAVKLQE